MENSSTIPATTTWQRVLRVTGMLLILLGAGGYLMKRERVSGQVQIGGRKLNQLALKPPTSPLPDKPVPPPVVIDEHPVKPIRPTPTPSATPTPLPVRPIRPVRPIIRPTPFPRPEPSEALPDDGSGGRSDDKTDDKKIRPSPPPPPPVPEPVRPTPAPTVPLPKPKPTPTPGEVLYYRVDPAPPPPLFHQEEVEGDYPGRLEKGAQERVRIRFVRKLVEKPKQTDRTTTNGDRTEIAQSIEPVENRPLDVPIEESQGTDYQAWIRCRLQSGSIEIVPVESAISPWRPLKKELTMEWEWMIRTSDSALRQDLEAEMEIEWRPLNQREKTITHRLWKETLAITVVDPLLKSGQLNVASPLLGGSGALLMLIGVLPIRRRKIGATVGSEKRKVMAAPPAPSPSSSKARTRPRESRVGIDTNPEETALSEPSTSIPVAAANVELAASQNQDVVECSVFAPPIAPQGETIMIQVFAHLEDLGAEAARLAIQFDPTARSRGVKTLSSRVARGSQLMFHLALSRLEITEPVQTLVWMGDTESVQFIVEIPADCRIGNIAGKVTISLETVPIGQISFLLRVVPAGTPVPEAPESVEPVGEEAHAYRYTFISYASEDRDKVLARVQMLDQMGIKYFQDLLSLDPGQRWERELYRNIDQCDLFLLFWSAAARRSDWVLKEVDYAISRKGGNDEAPPEIKPVIIEGPPLVEPPEKLKHLHFNDRLIYFMNRQTR